MSDVFPWENELSRLDSEGDLKELGSQLGLELEKPDELLTREKTGSFGQSRNRLRLAQNGRNLVVLKSYKLERDFPDPPEVRSENEIKVVSYLARAGFETLFLLASDRVAVDGTGLITTAFEYRDGLSSPSDVSKRVTGELFGEVEPIFSFVMMDLIAQIHKRGVLHGDLRIGNVGMIQPIVNEQVENVGVCLYDWEYATMEGETGVGLGARSDELTYLFSDIFANVGAKRGEQGIDRAIGVIGPITEQNYLGPLDDRQMDLEKIFNRSKRQAWFGI